MPTVLIGFAEALSAPEVAWDLLSHGFEVASYYRRGISPALRRIKEVELFSVTPPEIAAWATVEQLCRIAKSSGTKVLMPLDDASIWLCDKVSESLGIPVAGAAGKAALFALDKQFQLREANEAGFNVPESTYIGDKRDLSSVSQLPVVIKPALAILEKNGKLVKGPIAFCIGQEDLNRLAHQLNYDGLMIAQPVLTGVGEGLFGLAGSNGVEKWSAHQRVRMMNPLGSGSSACMSLRISNHPIQAAERMLKKVGWRGMFMIELFRDSDGKLWFMEFNGRSWGSMALALRLGLHYPAWTVLQRLDPSFAPPETSPWRPLVCRHLGREILHLFAVLKGKKEYKLLPNYSRIKTLLDVCHFSPRDEWYNWRRGNQLLFWEDTIKTITTKLFRAS